jgi:hypothetical protein
LKTIREEARGAEERAQTVVEFVLLGRVVVVELRMPSPFAFPFANVELRGMSNSICRNNFVMLLALLTPSLEPG